ncbi:MAG: N-6 DNA methylase, partial [Methanosarcina sp.]|nr:N-6 DNA methylase [Methanosarcina sp.]
KTLIENNLIYAMLTLPSNMFYTVALPATLWFFDRAKKDNRILFIDARNIFTQIDRAHREFTEEQIHNIAVISSMRREKSEDFIRLVHSYFDKGMVKLINNKESLKNVAVTLINYLKAFKENDFPDFAGRLEAIKVLEKRHKEYLLKFDIKDLDNTNKIQRKLAESFKPFFIEIHEMLRSIDKKVRSFEKDNPNKKETRTIKEELIALHQEIKDAEYFFSHINWLQERFPHARYEDVTGLCKLATIDEIREQDYSLNPGRYVGVVIEEDGKSEEEFIEEMLAMNQELNKLNKEAKELEEIIHHNILELTGEK